VRARVSQSVVEVLIPTGTHSPTTPTGAGISQSVVEVLTGMGTAGAQISQSVVEVLVPTYSLTQGDPEDPGAGAGGGVKAFGYAS
jgi:hypothetical protein